jgi:hypothetical protein
VSGQREATEALRARIAESKLELCTGEYGDIDDALEGYTVLGAAVERVLDLCDEWAYEGNTMITRSHAFCSGPPKASARTVEAASWS